MPANVWILFIAQALAMCAAPLMVFSAALASRDIAPSPEWATLPIAMLVVGTATFVYPAAQLAKAFGRKKLFLLAMLVGSAASLMAMLALKYGSFPGFIVSAILLGCVIAVGQQFRFAAMECVEKERMPLAASRLMVAGLISAWLGPELVPLGQNFVDGLFSGAFVLLSALYIVSFVVIGVGFSNPDINQPETEIAEKGSGQIWRRPGFWAAAGSAAVGYGVMSFIMTATPVSMHEMQNFSLEDTKWVIQSHIMAMFIPSLFAGRLIQLLGHVPMILTGLAALLVTVVIGILDQTFMHYWWALLLLGVAWNFLFVAGTALLPTAYKPEEAHKAQGLNDLLVFSTQALGALSSGIILQWFGWNLVLLFTLPITISLVLYIIWWRQRPVSGVGR
jgi:MFS family permease